MIKFGNSVSTTIDVVLGDSVEKMTVKLVPEKDSEVRGDFARELDLLEEVAKKRALDVADVAATAAIDAISNGKSRDDAISCASDEALAAAETAEGYNLSGLKKIREELSDERRAEMREKLSKSIVGWDLQDEKGDPLSVTKENIEAVLDHTFFFVPLAAALRNVSRGQQAKN